MTRREIFEKARKHLLAQGRRAERVDRSECRYRTSSNLMCAVGCLIPDELYTEEIEGRAANKLPKDILEHILGPHYTTGDIDFLVRLQIIHDRRRPAQWEAELTAFELRELEAGGLV